MGEDKSEWPLAGEVSNIFMCGGYNSWTTGSHVAFGGTPASGRSNRSITVVINIENFAL